MIGRKGDWTLQRREREGILGNGRTEGGPPSLSVNPVIVFLLIQRSDWEEGGLDIAEKRERAY